MDYKIDLHVHSYMSDGSCSPKKIIKLASEKGIKAIALTDHDSVEGVNDAAEEALRCNMDFLKGIEISSSYKDGRILHILGLGVDINNGEFLGAYTRMKKAREEAVEEILNILKMKGISIDIKILKSNSLNGYLDRYDIHRHFIRSGICNSSQQIWDKYLDPIPYGKDQLLEVEEAIDIIKKSGGLSFLAHYNKKIGLQGFTKDEMENHIKHLKSIGLNGVEEYYPSYNSNDAKFLKYLINKYSFISSGGTDFHGENRPEISLGIGSGNFHIPYRIYENIVDRLN